MRRIIYIVYFDTILIYWDRHLDDKPPLVGFTAKYDLQIATLINRKPFKTQTKILKTLKYGDVKQYFRYSCAKYSWCIDINVLNVKERNESYVIYTKKHNPESQNIIMPIINLILPDIDELNCTNFYACYEFINYNKREFEKTKAEDTVINYKIRQDIIHKIMPQK